MIAIIIATYLISGHSVKTKRQVTYMNVFIFIR